MNDLPHFIAVAARAARLLHRPTFVYQIGPAHFSCRFAETPAGDARAGVLVACFDAAGRPTVPAALAPVTGEVRP